MVMSKIGILTFFDADNYGALLQCYALSEFCKINGYDVEVINYHSKQMFSWKHRLKRMVAKSLQNKRFDLNRRTFFEIGSTKDNYETLIVGSDQVWNPSIIKGDKNWIEPKIKYNKIISYAASLGKGKLDDNEKTFLLGCNFNIYDWVSVREKTGQKLLEEIGVHSEVVCDPTLLFYDAPDAYNNLVDKSNLDSNNYIFVYSLEKSDKIDEISKTLSKKYGYNILSAHPANCKTQYCNEFIMDSDICDFLYLIKNAKMIITNSFHGLAFSYIYKKDVFAVCHTSLSSRQTDLIENSGIEYEMLDSSVFHINNYSNDQDMKKYTEKSRLLLRKALSKQ